MCFTELWRLNQKRRRHNLQHPATVNLTKKNYGLICAAKVLRQICQQKENKLEMNVQYCWSNWELGNLVLLLESHSRHTIILKAKTMNIKHLLDHLKWSRWGKGPWGRIEACCPGSGRTAAGRAMQFSPACPERQQVTLHLKKNSFYSS